MAQFHDITDIVVVGSGLAGLGAAIEAAQAGRSVRIIEKMKITGETRASAMEPWRHLGIISKKKWELKIQRSCSVVICWKQVWD